LAQCRLAPRSSIWLGSRARVCPLVRPWLVTLWAVSRFRLVHRLRA